jgi:alkylmercury lyase
MKVELLFFDGCPGQERFLPRIEALAREAGAEVGLQRVDSVRSAEEECFLGSPTVRVNGHDIDPTASERDDYGLKCRLYRTASGTRGMPPEELLRAALARAADLEQLAHAICGARTDLEPTDQRIALGIYRLLAEGRPVAPRAAARRLGVRVADVDYVLEGWPAAVHDEQGRVIGYGGLGLDETPHRLDVAGRRLYGWCAWDTLFLPELLGAGADVKSTCPATGKSIALRVSPRGVTSADARSTVVSMIVPAEPFGDDVIDTFCCNVRFYATEDDAARSLADSDDSFTLTVFDAFELGKLANRIVFPDVLA